MKLDILLSAMFLKDYHYIETLNITGDCVIINQCDTTSHQEIAENNRHINYIETQERGLSKSRNMAIANSKADICFLCDNDVEYVTGYEEIILNEYRKHPEYDVIAFHVTSHIHPVPRYAKARRLNYITVGRISSVEISFRRDRVKNIFFNERIGAGTPYKMGEENVFLYDCLRQGLHIHYVPIKVAELRNEISTWNTGFDEEFFIARGATFYAMTPSTFAELFVLQFALRKLKYYKDMLSLRKALHFMHLGIKQYKKGL